jgi:murein DD-endopeptidase MepM/ murein hydrolase activator NlpD
MRPASRFRSVFWVIVPAALACGRGGVETRFVISTPHEEYQARLRAAGLHETALGRDWLMVAKQAVTRPLEVLAPHREVRYLDPTTATAVAYQLTLERGQRFRAVVEADAPASDLRVFMDLFRVPDSFQAPELVQCADSLARELEYVALQAGSYVLRIQPELLRGGRLTLTVSTHASLGFPVMGRNMTAVRSRFGAPRDGGRREHHGVDIFAPRGTPVLAAAAGRVTRVGERGLGGNVVWLRDAAHGRSLYYAHLDRYLVSEGMWVEPGDTLGFVGNTGNARTTPPHLHFGIYLRGRGPVDPHYHIYEPDQRPATFAGAPELVGGRARVVASGTRMRTGPSVSAPTMGDLGQFTPLDILAGSGRWYLVRLPDGREGFVALSAAEALDPPI